MLPQMGAGQPGDFTKTINNVLLEFSNAISPPFDHFSGPPVPMVSQRLPGCDRVYVASMVMHPFEPPPAERRLEVFFIGVFKYSAAKLSQLRETIIIDDRELHPRNFGEKEAPRYSLIGIGESIQKVRVCPGLDPFVRCWCIIQAVAKKPIVDVVRDTCERGNVYFPLDELRRQFFLYVFCLDDDPGRAISLFAASSDFWIEDCIFLTCRATPSSRNVHISRSNEPAAQPARRGGPAPSARLLRAAPRTAPIGADRDTEDTPAWAAVAAATSSLDAPKDCPGWTASTRPAALVAG
jgi:hypothetical protein